MRCMKCGRETQEQTFCQSCLEDMARSPVKPGTPVVIFERSNRRRRAAPKKDEHEEQIRKLNRTILHLKIWVVVMGVLFIFSAVAAGFLYFTSDDKHPIGQNYNTVVDSPPSTG